MATRNKSRVGRILPQLQGWKMTDKMPEKIWAVWTRNGAHGVYGSWTTNEHPTDFEGKVRTRNRKRTPYTLTSTVTAQLAAADGMREAIIAVLCDPEGKAWFAGSDGDRAAVDDALQAYDNARGNLK